MLLKPLNGDWKMTAVRCSAPRADTAAPAPAMPALAPEQTVESFYRWYLDYIGTGPQQHNPLVDKAYRASEYLAPAFVHKVDRTITTFDTGGYDPFLCAQDVPGRFDVAALESTGEMARVSVSTDFSGHSFVVQLARVDDRWMIDDVLCADRISPTADSAGYGTGYGAGWQSFQDETHGFRMRYPGDWVALDVPIRDLDEVKPVVRVVQFLPREWADQLAQGDNSIIAPLILEVSMGGLQEYRRMYVQPTQTETVTVGSATYLLEILEAGGVKEMRYVWQSPNDERLRVTLLDMLSGFPQRMRDHAPMAVIVKSILGTMEVVKE